jgi:hypothetical protein
MLKVAIALVLLAHGIGHSLGLLQLSKVATVGPGWQGGSWLLTGAAGVTAAQVVGGVLWSASMIGFVASAAAVLGWLPVSWFTPLAVFSAIVSLLGLALFPTALPVSSTIGALIVDVAVLVAVLWFRWMPTDLAA